MSNWQESENLLEAETIASVENFLRNPQQAIPAPTFYHADDEIPLAAFCAEIGLRMEFAMIPWPNLIKRWTPTATAYSVTLTRGKTGTALVKPWHMGMPRDFSGMDVLDSLRVDAETGDQCETVDDLVSEFGMESFDGSIAEAQRIFKACKETASELREFLGDDLYADLMNRVARL